MKINHIGFLTKDINKSLKEFKHLGFAVEKETVYDSCRKVNILFLINDYLRIELIEPKLDSPIYPLLKRYKNTPYHICYESNNFNEDIDYLLSEGFSLFKEPEIAPAMDNSNVCFLIGVDSGITEIVEKK